MSKSTKIYVGVVASIIALFALIMVLIPVFVEMSYPLAHYYTTSKEEYFSKKCDMSPADKTIFLEELPDNATVVDFSYYKHFFEDRDIYLELRFSNVTDLENYVKSLKSRAENYIADTKGFYKELENPYNSTYKDIFCTVSFFAGDINRGDEYIGYEPLGEAGSYVDCILPVISYSVEELTVIQSYTIGSFNVDTGFNNTGHLPKYFERFQIDLSIDQERRIYRLRNSKRLTDNR